MEKRETLRADSPVSDGADEGEWSDAAVRSPAADDLMGETPARQELPATKRRDTTGAKARRALKERRRK